MRKLFLLAGVLSCAVVVLGCPKKKDDGSSDAAAEAEAAPVVDADAAAAPAAPVAITAKNTADVARFPGEAPVADDDLKLAQPTLVRTSPKSGTIITTLKPGSDVTKIAEYQASILVTFADPKDAASTLIGWIAKEAFTAVVIRDAGPKVDAGKAKLVCAAGTVAVVLAADPVCKRKCVKDADCKGIGAGTCVNANSAAGGVVRVCPD